MENIVNVQKRLLLVVSEIRKRSEILKRGEMPLPAYEDISIGKTKRFVLRSDIDNFNSYLESLKNVVVPFEAKARNCDIEHIIEDGHVIETAIERLNEEIARMANWASRDLRNDTEKLAKNFVDIRTEYLAARNSIDRCTCKRSR